MKINALTILLIIFLPIISFAGDYPKSKVEKEMEEMGSVLGGEGIVFRPGKTKATETKATIGKVNKYLFQAAINVLNFAPLVSADSNGGVIITDWYNSPDQPNTKLKVHVYIKDQIISTEALEVIVYEKKRAQGKWSEDYKKSAVSFVIEDKILRRARELYQQSK